MVSLDVNWVQKYCLEDWLSWIEISPPVGDFFSMSMALKVFVKQFLLRGTASSICPILA
jgi:hypothetical protein